MKSNWFITVCSIGVVIITTLALTNLNNVNDTAAQTQVETAIVHRIIPAPQLCSVPTQLAGGLSVPEPIKDKVPTYDSLPLSTELQEYTYNLCVEYDIVDYYELMLAIMWKESNFDPSVISDTNDYGIMQINTIVHEWLTEQIGVTDFLDPEQNIHSGVYLMAGYLHKYEHVNLALMCYGLGETGAKKQWSRGVYSTYNSRNVMYEKWPLVLSNEYPEIKYII